MAESRIQPAHRQYGFDATRDTTTTSNGNIYGYVYDGVCMVNGWVVLSSTAKRNDIVATGLPKAGKNANLICYDQATDSAFALYIRGGATQIMLDYEPTNHKGTYLNFAGVYLTSE